MDRFFGKAEGGREEMAEREGDRERELELELELELETSGELRAGEEYKIWNSLDVDGSLPGEYVAVIEHGERTVGMQLRGMLAAFERRLARWKCR